MSKSVFVMKTIITAILYNADGWVLGECLWYTRVNVLVTNKACVCETTAEFEVFFPTYLPVCQN